MKEKLRRYWPFALLAALLSTGIAAFSLMLAPDFIRLDPSKTKDTQKLGTPAKPDKPIKELAALPEEIAEPEEEEAALTRETAKTINDAIPFAGGSVQTIAPFKFRGGTVDRARALECLAAAQLYEAGNDAVGQRAVAQVVLNRVRHPAFPSSICGVVFQGSERRTGCQFSFTCDGSLRRRYSDASWRNARAIAAKAMDGSVYKKVQTATHYHTDWVHPYWSAKLHKIAAVDTHLFFRWPGYWGTRGAFRSGGGAEPLIPKLAFRPGHKGAEALATENLDGNNEETAQAAEAATSGPTSFGVSADILGGNKLVARHPEAGAYLVKLKRGQGANNMLTLGLRLCGNQSYCNIMGWFDGRSIPAGWPVDPSARSKMTFNYLRDRSRGVENVQFDCDLFKRPLAEQCL